MFDQFDKYCKKHKLTPDQRLQVAVLLAAHRQRKIDEWLDSEADREGHVLSRQGHRATVGGR